MDKKIPAQIEAMLANSDLNEEQRERLLSDLKNRKKSPNNFIRHGDIESLRALIDDGIDVNEDSVFGTPPLMTAIMYSDIEIVKLLIEKGANVNAIVNNVLPIIATAIVYSDSEIVKLLIENGADVNVMANNEPLIVSVLTLGDNEIVKLLIENGAKIEFENSKVNLLAHALLYSNTEIVELCIEKGSKFSQDILFDVVLKAKDGYVFDRKHILKILDEKNKFREAFSGLQRECNLIIENEESFLRFLDALYDEEKSTNTQEQNIHLLEKYNDDINKRSKNLNKLHKRLDKIKSNTKIINAINDMQDKMTVLTIFDFIKIFIKYGGDVDYKDENGSTVLMVLAYHGHEDCVKLLIDNGAEIDIQNLASETALLLAYENNHFNIVKLLIESGADVNITMYNDERFDKKAKYDKNYEVLEWIKSSPTYIEPTHDPKELVKILSNFTIDKPIKYTTHSWDFGELKKEYGNFDGYMSAVKKQFEGMKEELEKLSPNLYQKIYTFLIEENPDPKYSWCQKANINIGWSSLKGLGEWCDSGKKAEDFQLMTPIPYNDDFETIKLKYFRDVINLFKQEIEIRDNFSNLENLFANQIDHLGENFILDLTHAKLNRQFYTDSEKFSNVLDKIFSDISTRQQCPSIEVITTELEDRSIEIRITQINSGSGRSAKELYDRASLAGDISEIKNALTNLCDWSVESSYQEENFRVNFLHSNNVKEIEILDIKPKGFTHILRFYK